MVGTLRRQAKMYAGMPWCVCLGLSALIPVFPEYVCPFLALGALIAAHCDARRRGSVLSVGPIGAFLLLYMAYMLIGTLYSNSPLQTLSTVAMWAVSFMVYAAVTTVVVSRERLKVALLCVTTVAGGLGALATVQYVFNKVFHIPMTMQVWNWLDERVYTLFPMELVLNQSGIRAAATYNNPNVFAAYLIMAIPLMIAYAFGGDRTHHRLFGRICLFAAGLGVAFSFSRSAYMGLIAIVGVILLANLNKLSSIGISILAALMLLPESVVKRFTTFSLTDIAITERLKIWSNSMQSIAAHPLFGLGAGVKNTWDMLLASGVNAPHTHNLILQLLSEGGAVNLILFTMIGYPVWKGGMALLSSGETHMMGNVLLSFLAGFFFYGLTDFPLLSPKGVAVFLMVLAFSDSLQHVLRGEPQQQLRSLTPRALWKHRADGWLRVLGL